MTVRSTLGQLKRDLLPSKSTWSDDRRAKAAMDQYEMAHGYRFDIEHPRLFTEKVIWYKLFYQRDDLVRAVDKYLFKEYIREILGEGYTVPLLGAWESVEELRCDWGKLPEEFCLKSTLMSDGRNIKIIHHKSQEDPEKIFHEVKGWLNPKNTLINSFCRAYYTATPRVLAEEYIAEFSNQLTDYKVFCFNGEPYCTYTVTERFEDNGAGGESLQNDYSITFFDLNWKKMDVVVGGHRNTSLPKPKYYEKMLEISRILSKNFPFVRVDFYALEDKLYVGELTLYPSGGLLKYEPRSFNEDLGRRFILPEQSSEK